MKVNFNISFPPVSKKGNDKKKSGRKTNTVDELSEKTGKGSAEKQYDAKNLKECHT